MEEKEKIKTPEFVTKRVDLKYETLQTFAKAIAAMKSPGGKVEPFPQDVQLILYTDFGMIEGEVQTFVDEQSVQGIFTETVFKCRNEQLAKLETKQEINVVNNYGIIVVKNAAITPYANFNFKNNVAELYLFTDQITGFTFGAKKVDLK